VKDHLTAPTELHARYTSPYAGPALPQGSRWPELLRPGTRGAPGRTSFTDWPTS
jgi:hypothetical protein